MARCRASGCARVISETKLFCVIHWDMLPKANKSKLMDLFEAGKKILDQNQNLPWAKAAVSAIKLLELLEAQKNQIKTQGYTQGHTQGHTQGQSKQTDIMSKFKYEQVDDQDDDDAGEDTSIDLDIPDFEPPVDEDNKPW